ncbi:MAG: CPBP family intramembrane metalloprotease [Armatimonadetes bacterium]|nr:CPBP family intramembrane metalloprotease [Armatimonadota bacterium]
MNWSLVAALLRHELRMVYRDHRTVILSVLLPVLVTPLLLWSVRAVEKSRESLREQQIYRLVVAETDSAEAARIRDLIEQARRLAGDEGFRLKEATFESPLAALQEGRADLLVDFLDPQEARRLEEAQQAPGSPRREEEGLGPAPTRERRLELVPAVRIRYAAGENRSLNGAQLFVEWLEDVRQARREILLQQAGITAEGDVLFEQSATSVADEVRQTAAQIGPYLCAFLVMLLLGGGSVAALDILAGERERGTLETLLTSAAGRREILSAKQLAVLSVALVISAIQVANLTIYLVFELIDLPDDFQLRLGWDSLAALLVLVLPLAALIAAVLVAVSGRAGSYKEAQQLYFPAFVVCLALSLASVLPQVTLRSALVVVPLANIAVGMREVLLGTFSWPLILVAAAVTGLTAGFVIRDTASRLAGEELFAETGEDEWSPLVRYSLQVWRWFAVMAALLVVVPPNVPMLSGLQGQVLFNQLGVFLLIPLLMRHLYGLRAVKMFALRPVRAPVWIAILLLVPASHVLATGLVQVTNLFIPVPEEMMEEMSRQLVPAGMTTWHLLVLLAVLPGICEELAFRGALLYGLHRRLRPAWLVLWVGLIFGFFHFTIFRIAPTAFTGAVLTAVALLTGSVFPCILAHIANNAMAVVAYRAHFAFTDLAWPAYLVAMVAEIVAFYILWRVRTPYPGLRGVDLPRKSGGP